MLNRKKKGLSKSRKPKPSGTAGVNSADTAKMYRILLGTDIADSKDLTTCLLANNNQFGVKFPKNPTRTDYVRIRNMLKACAGRAPNGSAERRKILALIGEFQTLVDMTDTKPLRRGRFRRWFGR